MQKKNTQTTAKTAQTENSIDFMNLDTLCQSFQNKRIQKQMRKWMWETCRNKFESLPNWYSFSSKRYKTFTFCYKPRSLLNAVLAHRHYNDRKGTASFLDNNEKIKHSSTFCLRKLRWKYEYLSGKMLFKIWLKITGQTIINWVEIMRKLDIL